MGALSLTAAAQLLQPRPHDKILCKSVIEQQMKTSDVLTLKQQISNKLLF